MPNVGQRFGKDFAQDLKAAFRLNPSIHDGAILFQRGQEDVEYYLSAWSMRIVSQHTPFFSEPNLGSAYNSTLALSMATAVDACCVLSSTKVVFFVDGRATTLKENS